MRLAPVTTPWLLLCFAGCASQTAQSPSAGAQATGEPRSDLAARGTSIRVDPAAAPAEGALVTTTPSVTPAAGAPGAEGAAAPEPGEPPLPPGSPVVRILDAGGVERRKLRYHIVSARAETMVMDMTMTIDMSMSGRPAQSVTSPPIHAVMQIEAAPGAASEIAFNSRLTAFDVLPSSSTPPDKLEEMRKALAPLLGLAASGRMNTRGLALSLEMQVPPGLPDTAKAHVDRMRESMKDLATPLPIEPVGVGARWEVETTAQMNEFAMKATRRYLLRELGEHRAVFDLTMDLTAPRQEMKLPEAAKAQGMTASIESLQGTGSGQLEMDTESLVPRASKLAMEMAASVKMSHGGQAIDMQMKTRMEVVVQPGR